MAMNNIKLVVISKEIFQLTEEAKRNAWRHKLEITLKLKNIRQACAEVWTLSRKRRLQKESAAIQRPSLPNRKGTSIYLYQRIRYDSYRKSGKLYQKAERLPSIKFRSARICHFKLIGVIFTSTELELAHTQMKLCMAVGPGEIAPIFSDLSHSYYSRVSDNIQALQYEGLVLKTIAICN